MVKDYSYYYTLPEERYEEELKLWFNKWTGKELDLERPKTFNEKVQWLKLYDSTPLKTRLADKYLVRDWIKEQIGEEYLIPMLGAWDRFDDIDFDQLPDQFVLKANQGSGWNRVVRDKQTFDRQEAKEKFDDWTSKNFGFVNGFELHYSGIPPKIVAEKYMADFEGDIFDYRFFCFNGEPKYVWVDLGNGTKHHTRTIFDIDWNVQDYRVNYPLIDPQPPKPQNYELMCELARKLCAEFALVRVDFYNIDGKIYFGEMSFTSQGGRGTWEKEEQNLYYGSLLKLPPKSKLPPRNPVVSVIIPAYNAEKTIRECLDSLLAQTLKNLEIICVDDGSTDNTVEVLREYTRKDPRVTVLQQKNLYAGVARNAGLRIARGDYVIFLDADDFFHPDMLMEMSRKGLQQRADVVVCGVTRYHDKERTMLPSPWMLNMNLLPRKDVFSAEDIPEKIFSFTTPAPWNKMFRREFVLEQDIWFQDSIYANDLRFTLTSLSVAKRISVVNRELVYYRIGQTTNLQSVKSKHPLVFLDVLNSFKDQLITRGRMEALQKSYLNTVWSTCLYELKSSNGEAYESKYTALKSHGCHDLGLAQAKPDMFFSRLRYNQLKAILTADVMIKIV